MSVVVGIGACRKQCNFAATVTAIAQGLWACRQGCRMSTGINLLPWREERQRLQQRRTIMGSAVIGLVAAMVVAAVWLHFSEEIAFQKKRNKYLSAEIKKTEAQLKEIEKIKELEQALELAKIPDVPEFHPAAFHSNMQIFSIYTCPIMG